MQQVQKQCEPVEVVIELTEHHHNISIAKLAVAAQQYQNAHLWVCLDDVGTGDNTATLAEQLDPYITEYKFALQNFRQHTDFSTIISPLLQFWRKFAEIHHKFFAIEGFENVTEIAIGQPIMLIYYKVIIWVILNSFKSMPPPLIIVAHIKLLIFIRMKIVGVTYNRNMKYNNPRYTKLLK